jgi:hypothetical protein
MAFPATILGLRTELLINGTWTDISKFVNQGTGGFVVITRGHPDESTTTTASATGLTLVNEDFRFSARYPLGPYYPFLGRNVPLRLSVPDAGTYLRLEGDQASSASTPDSVALSVTGSVDVRVDLQLSGWEPGVIAAKWDPTTGSTNRSWILTLNADGTVTFAWSTTGSDLLGAVSTAPLPLGRSMIRATMNATNGTVQFFTAATMAGSETGLGAAVTGAGATSIHDSTAHVTVGNYDTAFASAAGINGQVYEFQYYNGIGGTKVADPVFTAQAAGAATFADAQSNTWTMNGTGELSNRNYRLHTEATSWPQFWASLGKDITVQLSANGILRRVSQGDTPVLSAMTRAFERISGTLAPVAYWPMEDGAAATSLASGIGGPPMAITGSPDLASDSSFACSAPLPVMNGATFSGAVPKYASNGSIIVRFLLNVQAAPGDGARIMRVVTNGTCQLFSCYYGTGGKLGLAGYASDGSNVFDTGELAFGVLAEPCWVSMELQPGGGSTVDYDIVTLVPGATSGLGFSGSFTGTIGNAAAVQPAPTQALGQVTIGQVSVQSAWESLFALSGPLMAWQGETAASRFIRLCSEESVPSRCYGAPADSMAMGAQTLQTFEQLLQECVDADRGLMYEPFESLALAYRTRASMLNQVPKLTIAYGQLANELRPTEDDQAIANDVTVTQAGDGSSARQFAAPGQPIDGGPLSVLPPAAGVGTYDGTAPTVNLASDAELGDRAGWELWLGTVDEPRYPAMIIDLATFDTGVLALFYAVLAVRPGDRILVTSPPAWLPPGPIDQLAGGFAENLYDKVCNLAFACIPAAPWNVSYADAADYGWADTDGSVLHAGATTTTTTITVDPVSAAFPLWTTSGAEMPFDVMCGGEQMTVTAIASTTAPQTLTVTRSVNGIVKAHLAGDDIRLAHTPTASL